MKHLLCALSLVFVAGCETIAASTVPEVTIRVEEVKPLWDIVLTRYDWLVDNNPNVTEPEKQIWHNDAKMIRDLLEKAGGTTDKPQ